MATEELKVGEEAVADWLTLYGRAWMERDADLAASLFTPDAEYYERRFVPPLVGVDRIRDYWTGRVVENQRDIEFTFELWAVRGPRAYYQWRARLVWLPINGLLELDGAGKLTFAAGPDSPLCARFEEWIDRRGA